MFRFKMQSEEIHTVKYNFHEQIPTVNELKINRHDGIVSKHQNHKKTQFKLEQIMEHP
jgi:hypothetical protein